MINYITYGSEENDKLLFLHGALVDNSMWASQIDALRKDFYVITCDLPEHGSSGNLGNEYKIENLSDVISDFLVKLNIEVISICGHSLGGMIAQQFSATYPHKVQKLILAETAYGTRTNFFERLLTLVTKIAIPISKKQLIKISVKTYAKLNKSTGEYIKSQMNQFDGKQMQRIMGAALDYDGKKNLKRIKAQTLILVSIENTQTHEQAIAMNRLIENSKLEIIEKSHHLLNMDNPVQFNSEIVKFLKE